MQFRSINHRLAFVVMFGVALGLMTSCKSRIRDNLSSTSSLDSPANGGLPVVTMKSSDQQKTVTLIGMVHVAPMDFYSQVVEAMEAGTKGGGAILLEEVKCSKSEIDPDRIYAAIPFPKSGELISRFGKAAIDQAIALDKASPEMVNYFVSLVTKWIAENKPEKMVSQTRCKASGIDINDQYTKLAEKLTQETGREWVFQIDKNSPYFKFISKRHDASKLAIENVDIDMSDRVLRNPNHLLWYYSISSDVKLVSGDTLTTNLLNVVSRTINKTGVRNLILEHGVGKAIEAGYKNIVLPWGANHIPDLIYRLKKQGYSVASQSSITYNPHCSQARAGSLEAALCFKIGITPLRNKKVAPSTNQSDLVDPDTDLGTGTGTGTGTK